MGITFWQERKTERALEALRDSRAPRLVIRDGEQVRIPGRDVVEATCCCLRGRTACPPTPSSPIA